MASVTRVLRSICWRSPRSLSVVVLAAALAITVGACGSDATTARPIPTTAAGPSVTPSDARSLAPEPTAVPGGVSTAPGPPATRIPVTQTDWGAILDAVPDSFPRLPGAEPAEPPAEPVSDALLTSQSVDDVAAWYRDALEAAGYSSVDLSDPLEDGSRVLDTQSDVPECRIQLTFRPMGESTMITVLYGAGCAGAGG